METDFQFDNTWTLHSIAGDTGKSYMGIRNTEKVFIKRNTTPFLAALSQEGVAPKLLWTKRTGTGDIITAQEWLDGNVLSAADMKENQEVIKLLLRLHHSSSLKNMLSKVGGHKRSAFDFLREYAQDVPQELKDNHYLHRVFRYLEDHLPSDTDSCVCHGDPVHHNWYVSNDQRLYLVDWDNCVLADPVVDVAYISCRYIPKDEWQAWLQAYGVEVTPDYMQKVQWYIGMMLLLNIKHYHLQQNNEKIEQELKLLKDYFIFE
ncbi:phosphotransferase family protein [Vagococcus zengguangii]|uniref:phosphotransferase family protein n=1 Tax=Vagococcus zengguangii TaxID=2571750 RepID=UPI0014851FB0|nr:phosphotransferase family protein [Vagococcus zengguangii]